MKQHTKRYSKIVYTVNHIIYIYIFKEKNAGKMTVAPTYVDNPWVKKGDGLD